MQFGSVMIDKHAQAHRAFLPYLAHGNFLMVLKVYRPFF